MGHRRRPGLNLSLTLLMLIGSFLTIAPETGPVYAAPQISLTSPSAGSTSILSEGDDYAKTILSDPWDMNEISDIRKEYSFNTTDMAVVDGVLSFKSGPDSSPYNSVKTPSNPQIVLLFPGYANSDGSSATQNMGKLGVNYPIDATKYKQLSFRMYLSSVTGVGASQSQARVVWGSGSSLMASAYSAIGTSKGIPVYEGWHTYSVDLSAIGLDAGTVIWGDPATAGTVITGLRLDPTTDAGVTIMIDWVRLTPAATPSTTQIISWTRPSDSSTGVVSLKVVTDTAAPVYAVIKQGLVTTGSSSYGWGTADLPPGRYYVKAEIGTDWASMVRDDAWDMKEASDVYPDGAGSNAKLSFAGGVMTGVNKDADPYFHLAFNPNSPISAAVFSKLSIRMTSSKADSFQVMWKREGDTEYKSTDPSAGRTFAGESRIYTVDLSGNSDWSGNIKYLRIDPMVWGVAGDTWQIDWVALDLAGFRSVNEAAPSTAFSSGIDPMHRSAVAGDAWQGDWVGLDPAGVRSFDEPAPSTAYSSGTITINDAPSIFVTKPSMTTGEDYARSVLGWAWDMDEEEYCILNDRTGQSRVVDIGPYDFSNGVLSGVTKGTVRQVTGGIPESDNQLWLNTGVVEDKSDTPIDTSKYKYLTWRYWQEGTQDTIRGWVTRVAWWNQNAATDSSVTQSVVVQEGWNTYKLDLSRTAIEPAAGGTLAAHGWRDSVKYLRLDPNEVANAAGTLTTNFHLDYVKLTAPDVAYDSFDIRWTATSGISPTVSLYYDTDTNASNGMTLIASAVPADAAAYNWDASSVAEGIYYVYAKIQDAYNSSGRYSESPVIVKRRPSVAITQPSGMAPSLPLGGDYATTVLGNPWDMADVADIFRQTNLSGSFGGGIYSAQTTSNDPYVEFVNLIIQPDPGKYINANKYKRLTFRMYLSEPGLWQVIWAPEAGQNYTTALAIGRKGWNTYSVDLSSQTGWSGSIKYLRLDPVDQEGLTVKIAWIKLTDPSSSSQLITWSAPNLGNSFVSLYYDTDGSGRSRTLIASGLQGASYTWDTSGMPRGSYYIFAKVEDAVGPGVYSSASSVPVNIAGGVLGLANKVYVPALLKSSGAW